MLSKIPLIQALSTLLCIAALTACGSGGGNESNASTSNGADGGGVFSIANKTIEFNVDLASNNWGDAGVVTGSLTGASSPVYLFVEANRTPLITTADVYLSGTSGTLHLWPEDPGKVGAGNHTGTVRVKACKDANCRTQFQGSPIDITINYTVTAPNFESDRNAITFETVANSGQTTATQTVNLLSDAYFIPTTGYSLPSSSAAWLTVTHEWDGATGEATFTVKEGLTEGLYQTSVDLFIYGPSIKQTIDVTYEVKSNPLQITPTLSTFSVSKNSTTDALSQTFVISSTDGKMHEWQAEVSAPWLSLSQTQGSTNDTQSLTLRLNEALANLAHGTQSAILTITDINNPETVIYQDINLTLSTASVTAITPRSLKQEQATTVNIFGEGFIQDAVSVTIGGQAAAFEIINNKYIVATAPALPAGQYDVQVFNSKGLSLSRHPLNVMDAPNYEIAHISLPNTPEEILYDEPTQTLYSYLWDDNGYTTESGLLYKQQWDNGQWVSSSLRLFETTITDISLTPDGKYLAALGTYSQDLILVNLETFTIEKSYTYGFFLDTSDKSISFYDNANALIKGVEIWRFNIYGGMYHDESFGNFRYRHERFLFADNLTELLLIGQYSLTAQYNRLEGTIAEANIPQNMTQNISADANGHRIILDDTLYEKTATGEWINKGYAGFLSQITPDGQYGFYRVFDNDGYQRVDFNKPDGNGEFIAVGEPIAIEQVHGVTLLKTFTPDGRFGFLGHDNGITVLPLEQ